MRNIYIDIIMNGFKMDIRVNADVFSSTLHTTLSISLPVCGGIFQTEILAILETCCQLQNRTTEEGKFENILGQSGGQGSILNREQINAEILLRISVPIRDCPMHGF